MLAEQVEWDGEHEMRPLKHFDCVVVALSLVLFTGCPSSTVSSLEAGDERGAKVSSPPPVQASEPRIEPAQLDAEQLAGILQIQAWTFRYSGGRVRCWLEIEEEGKKTIEPPSGAVQDPNVGNEKAEEGKILLWWKRGELALRIQSGVSEGGYIKGLPEDALWRGWKGVDRTSWHGMREPIVPDLDEEIILLHYEATERKRDAQDPDNPRKITITLKAEFPKEDDG